MMVPSLKGEEDSKSMTKPVFLDVLCQVMVVPVFTQNVALPRAFGILAVASAASAVLLTSTVQGTETDPQVLLALHRVVGFGSEQVSLMLLPDCACAPSQLNSKKNANKSEVDQVATLRQDFIGTSRR